MQRQTEEKVDVFIAEEQEILRKAYQAFLANSAAVRVVGVSADTSGEALALAASDLSPNVMLLGFKNLQSETVQRLERVRETRPNVAIALLSASYDAKGIQALREFSRGATGGCAYLLKHTIDTVDQLTQVVHSVAEGRIIVDPLVMDGFIQPTDLGSGLLKELSPRELEVLGWMAKGYRNSTIADVLCLDPKTIERHINAIYSKLGDDSEARASKHMRVYSIMTYLTATGLLVN